MTLFLIGNGFDLNCGMNTRFSDVYKEYVNSDSKSPIIEAFKREISSDIDRWSDFEMEMCDYAQSLKTEKEFVECVRDFSVYMREYLGRGQKLFFKRINDEAKEKIIHDEMVDSFSGFYKGISHNVNSTMSIRDAGLRRNIQVISFNYTEVFDYAMEKAFDQYSYRAPQIIHIHGKLGDDPTLGIDNENQWKAAYPLSRNGKRAFVKPFFNEEYDRMRVVEAVNIINSADTICTYGLALGESDLTWRNVLIDWLQRNTKNHLFVYRYGISQKTYRTVDEKMEIEEIEKINLLKEWGIDNSSNIFDRLHIPCGRNIFNIKLIY